MSISVKTRKYITWILGTLLAIGAILTGSIAFGQRFFEFWNLPSNVVEIKHQLQDNDKVNMAQDLDRSVLRQSVVDLKEDIQEIKADQKEILRQLRHIRSPYLPNNFSAPRGSELLMTNNIGH